VLGRNDFLAVGISGIIAYRSGFVFDCVVEVRDASRQMDPLGVTPLSRAIPESERFGLEVRLSDGRTARATGPWTESAVGNVHLTVLSSSGSGEHWDMRYLFVPLPEGDKLTFRCFWPRNNVLFESSMRADVIRKAAERSPLLWGESG
jgi:hypothetical protein